MYEINQITDKVNRMADLCHELGNDLGDLGKHLENIETQLSYLNYEQEKHNAVLVKMKEALEEL